MWSQTMLCRSCSPSMRDTNLLASQNCTVCGSDMRARADEDGAPQSVGSTGSHTISVRIGLPANSFRTSPVAEAPCKHTVQVGESSTSRRTSSLPALNAAWT